MSLDIICLELRNSHTSATNGYTAGPTSEVVTTIPDSVVQRQKLQCSYDKEAFSGNTV